MKKFTQFGFVALASLLLFATACKKAPSAKLYKTWTLESVEMPKADSVTLATIDSEGLTYTFNKGGDYSYSGAMSGKGTFEINDAGTSLVTTEDSKTETIAVSLTDNNLQLSFDGNKMSFTAKK